MLHNKSILSKLTAACNVSVVKARANSEKSGLFSVLVAEREQERERERNPLCTESSVFYAPELGNGLASFLPYATGHRIQHALWKGSHKDRNTTGSHAGGCLPQHNYMVWPTEYFSYSSLYMKRLLSHS